MYYALTLYLAFMSPMGNVVQLKSAPVFDTLQDCFAVGDNVPLHTPNGENKFTCDAVTVKPAEK